MIHERSNVHWYDIYFVDISSFSLIRFSLSFHHFSFLFLWNVVMRVNCDSPSLILIYAHWARRDLIIGAETEITPSVTFDYSPLTLRCSTIFFPSVGQSPSMRDAYSKFAISFRSDNEETFVWKRVQFVWKYFSETFFLVLRLMRI